MAACFLNVHLYNYRLSYLFGFGVGLYIFLNGFMLTRFELNYESNKVFPLYYRSQYKRVILLLVDSLAYEFFKENSTYLKKNQLFQKDFYSIFASNFRFLYLNRFLADPPTTTLQRLKALTTGGMPTFVDISSNFGASELMEDNLIKQWVLDGRRILFAGDELWTELFPNGYVSKLDYIFANFYMYLLIFYCLINEYGIE